MLTDVEGLYADWPASTEIVSQIGADELAALLPGLASGMVPKMEACLRAVEAGSRAPTCSTAGCRTRCCSRSSPARASGRWSSPTQEELA